MKLVSVISSFIWINKPPRIQPKKYGGVALPNIRMYYWAANSRCLFYWWSDTASGDLPGWLQIESSSCGTISLLALLCSSIPLHPPQTCHNLVVVHSLKKWSQFRKCYGLVSMSIYAPIMTNHLFPASLLDKAFTHWRCVED